MAHKGDALTEPVYGAPPQLHPEVYPPAYPQAPQYVGQKPVYAPIPPRAQAPTNHVQAPPIPKAPFKWTSSLCDCFDDGFSCCLTCLLPCVAFGQISQKVDSADDSDCVGNGCTYSLLCLLGLPCCYSCQYRSRMRRKYHLAEQPCNDFCTHCVCECCALCQEYRELQNRGIDPTQSSRQAPTVMMVPTPPMMD